MESLDVAQELPGCRRERRELVIVGEEMGNESSKERWARWQAAPGRDGLGGTYLSNLGKVSMYGPPAALPCIGETRTHPASRWGLLDALAISGRPAAISLAEHCEQAPRRV